MIIKRMCVFSVRGLVYICKYTFSYRTTEQEIHNTAAYPRGWLRFVSPEGRLREGDRYSSSTLGVVGDDGNPLKTPCLGTHPSKFFETVSNVWGRPRRR